MLDEKDLQSIQTMIDASIRAPARRAGKAHPHDQNRGHRGRRGSLETGDPLHEQGTGRSEKGAIKNRPRRYQHRRRIQYRMLPTSCTKQNKPRHLCALLLYHTGSKGAITRRNFYGPYRKKREILPYSGIRRIPSRRATGPAIHDLDP